MSIHDVKHQDHAIETLQLGLQHDHLAHGYVFYGPAGVGKTLTAREFAKVLLCNDRQDVPAEEARSGPWQDSCGWCESCKLLNAGTHPDCHVIYKELISLIPGKEQHKATELGIDVIRRELIDKIGHRPTLSRAKVFIILDAHTLSRSAQNAMLKVLEEPPAGTYILLLTEHLNRLLSTIRSRAQAVRFTLLPETFVRERLAEPGTDPRAQQFVAKLVGGQLGLALELSELGVYDLNRRLAKDLATLQPPDAEGLAKWILDRGKDLADRMRARTAKDVAAPASESASTRVALGRILDLVGALYQDALRRSLCFDDQWLTNIHETEYIDRLAGRASIEQLQDRIDSVREAQMLLNGNVNQGLVVSSLMSRLAD